MGINATARILIVESAVPAASGLLRDHGYNVDIARDGTDAYEQISARLPDIVILDARDPKSDGIEWCRLIKANPAIRDVKVVVMTNDGHWGRVFEAFAAGCDDYLVEPLDRTELALKMNELLKFSHLRGKMAKAAPTRRHWTPLL
jgi:DNA-binding response OmpR family regulator